MFYFYYLLGFTSIVRRSGIMATQDSILNSSFEGVPASTGKRTGNFGTELGSLVIENFSGYSDYHSPTPKVIVSLLGRAKLVDVRATLNTGAEVSVITLDAVERFEIPATNGSGGRAL